MQFYFLTMQTKTLPLQSEISCTINSCPIDTRRLFLCIIRHQDYIPSYTHLLQFSGVDIAMRSHVRYDVYLTVDNQHSKTFNNVVLVSKFSTLITSHILLRCCQSYFEQIFPICSVWLFPLLLSEKRLQICNVCLKAE